MRALPLRWPASINWKIGLAFPLWLLGWQPVLAQSTPVAKPDRLDTLMVTCFSQANQENHETAYNCASIAVIKLAMRRYGRDNVLLHKEELSNEYAIELRDGKKLRLTKAELASMQGLDKFAKGKDPAYLEAARFLYAVMAKNELLTQVGTHYTTVRELAAGGQLIPDADENFRLLGLEQEKVLLPIEAAYTQSGVIVRSARHVAYGGMGYYDQYGGFESDDNFRRLHSVWATRLMANRKIIAVYSLR